MRKGLSNKQFIFLALIIVICGILIIGRDYFLMKRANAYENMSILLSQEPDGIETTDTVDEVRKVSHPNDTSGKVKKKNVTYNYVARLKIPAIKLNRGFLKYGQSGNNVDQNIAVMKYSTFPDTENSHLILAGHSGSGWNAYFTNLDKLKKGDIAYVTYKNKKYEYQLTKIYKDKKNDNRVSLVQRDVKALTLVTCARPDYIKYFLVLYFELVSETDI